MHDVRRLGLQVFAAPNNMTGQAQVMVKAREIDFVTSFARDMQALLDILGITRMIEKRKWFRASRTESIWNITVRRSGRRRRNSPVTV